MPPPSAAQQKVLIAQFVALTGQSERQATRVRIFRVHLPYLCRSSRTKLVPDTDKLHDNLLLYTAWLGLWMHRPVFQRRLFSQELYHHDCMYGMALLTSTLIVPQECRFQAQRSCRYVSYCRLSYSLCLS